MTSERPLADPGRRRLLQGAAGAAVLATVPGLPGFNPRLLAAAKGELVAVMFQDPQALDPQQSIQTESFQAMLACFEQLYDYDPATDSFYPQIAAEMPDTSDPLNVVIKLRDDVVFHDGTPLTAEDVAYTFNFVIAAGPKSPAYSLYSMVNNVEAKDPHTVVFHLDYPYGLLVNYLSSIMGGIVKKDCRDTVDLKRAPFGVGCGPFEFVEWVQGSHLTFRKFPKYFRPGLPKFDTLTYRIIKEDATRVAQLVGGAVNFVDEPPKRDYRQLIARPDIDGAQGLSEKVGYIMINHANPMMQNVHLRRALSHATDRKAILDVVYEGFGVPAAGPMKPGTWWYDKKVEEIAHLDLAKAKEELSKSGLDKVRLDLRCENNTHHVDSATLLQAMWGQAGIEVDVIPMEKTAFYDYCKLGKPDWTVGYTDWSSSVYTPDYMVKLVYKSNGSYRRASYSNPRVDELIEAAQKSSDQAEQARMFSEMQLLMAEDVAAIWVAWYDWTPVWRANVKGFHVAPTYYDYFDTVSVE
jgi:peptide/nickel transport system substrate-binding protein